MQRSILITSGTQSQQPIDAAAWEHKVILYVHNHTTPSAVFPFTTSHADYLKPNTVLATVVSATWDSAGWTYLLDIPDAICETPSDLDTSWLDYCQIEEASPSALAKATDNEISKLIDTSSELNLAGTYDPPRALIFPTDLSEDDFEVDGTSKKLRSKFVQIGTGAPSVDPDVTPIVPPFYIDDTEGTLALYWYDPATEGWRALIAGEGASIFSVGEGDIGDPGVNPGIDPPVYFATSSGTLWLYYSAGWHAFEHPSQCAVSTSNPTNPPSADAVFHFNRSTGGLWVNNKATPTAAWVCVFDPTTDIIERSDEAASGTPTATPLHFQYEATGGIFKIYADGSWREPTVDLANLNLTGAVPAYAYGGYELISTPTDGSYDPLTWPPDARAIFVEAVGAGGAGGSCSNPGAAQAASGGGAGGGGYCASWFTDATAAYTYTIGLGGTAVADSAGNTGGSTIFKVDGTAQLTAAGGVGGAGMAAASQSKAFGGAGGAGTAGAGTTLPVTASGRDGTWGRIVENQAGTASLVVSAGSSGGSAKFGGGKCITSGTVGDGIAGVAGTNYGEGGSGACVEGGPAVLGGAGKKGCLIVHKYY